MTDEEAVGRAEQRLNVEPSGGCENCGGLPCFADEVIECKDCGHQVNSCACHEEKYLVSADFLRRAAKFIIQEVDMSAAPYRNELQLRSEAEDILKGL